MENETKELLTTGQAAKLCSVTPDTVLKWIKKGRLPAKRTAGGHYRVSRRDLDPWAEASTLQGAISPLPEDLPEVEGQEVPCWEYLSENGEVRPDCRQCVVYRVRATRCFLMAGMEADVGHARQFCQGSCEDCVYFRRLRGLSTKVLFITADDRLIQELEYADNGEVALRFARNGYEASTIVEEFRPAVVIIDVERLPDLGMELLDSLAADPRVSGVRVIMVVPPGMAARIHQRPRHRMVASILEKPLVCESIAEVVQGTVREPPPAEDRSA
jgi:excisionase family DNA binding protein